MKRVGMETTHEGRFEVTSNFQRELAFNLEHSIHHQALIKVA